MPISRTKFNPELPFVVARAFLFQSVSFNVGDDFPTSKIVCGMRQLRGLYSNRQIEVKQGNEVDTPATKRAKAKAPKKKVKKNKTIKVEKTVKEPASEQPWNSK